MKQNRQRLVLPSGQLPAKDVAGPNEGAPRRVDTFDYANPAIAPWGPWTDVSVVGGFILLAGALLFVWNLAFLYRGSASVQPMRYALAVHAPERLPRSLNGFVLWNWLVLFLMVYLLHRLPRSTSSMTSIWLYYVQMCAPCCEMVRCSLC